MKTKTCMFCGKSFTKGAEHTINYKNVRVTEHLIKILQESDICIDCGDRYVTAIHNLYDDIQEEKNLVPKLIDVTRTAGIRSALAKLPEKCSVEYFNALLDSDDILIDDAFYMVINRIGYREAYKRLDAIALAACVNRDLALVVEQLSVVVPKDEWRDDMRMFEKYGIDGSLNQLLLNRDTTQFLK